MNPKRPRPPFEYWSHLVTPEGFTRTIRKDVNHHPKGPFITGSRVEHVGHLPIVSRVRKLQAHKPNPIGYISQLLGILPKSITEQFGSLDNLNLGEASWLNCHTTFNLFSSYDSEYCIKDETAFAGHLLKKLKPFLRKLNLPYVEAPLLEDVYGIEIVPETHPGLLTRRACQIIRSLKKDLNKEECLLESMLLYERKWSMVHNGDLINEKGYYSVGGREKVNDTCLFTDPNYSSPFKVEGFEWHDEINTRPVMIPEFCDILFDSVYFQQFAKVFKDHCRDKSEIWFGHTHAYGG